MGSRVYRAPGRTSEIDAVIEVSIKGPGGRGQCHLTGNDLSPRQLIDFMTSLFCLETLAVDTIFTPPVLLLLLLLLSLLSWFVFFVCLFVKP